MTYQTKRVVLGPADTPSYEADYYTWALEQARLIRESRFAELDSENLAEEIESLGRSQYSSLRSYLSRVIQHMLKWDYQAGKRSKSWRRSINIHRIHVRQTLEENPGLTSRLGEALDEAYELAVAFTIDDTELPSERFPKKSPYDFETVMTRPIDDADDPAI